MRLAERLREQPHILAEPSHVICTDLLYADDTLLMSSSAAKLQLHMDLVVDEGSRYGLELSWSKTVAINIHNDGTLTQPNGEAVKKVSRAVYLGGMLTSSTSACPEVSRRIGEARGSFKSLEQCWSHANISHRRKIELYHACVVSKLLYGLESLWLLQRDLQRIDAFHAQCLRRIRRIPHSFVSRVSNAEVLDKAGELPMSDLLKQRQVLLYYQISH